MILAHFAGYAGKNCRSDIQPIPNYYLPATFIQSIYFHQLRRQVAADKPGRGPGHPGRGLVQQDLAGVQASPSNPLQGPEASLVDDVHCETRFLGTY